MEQELFDAVDAGDMVEVARLLEMGVNTDALDGSEGTSLGSAALAGHEEIVRLLLDRGAEIDARDGLGYTALHWAVSKGHTEIVRFLLERGADPNLRQNHGWNAIDLALHWEDGVGLLELVLQHGADPNDLGPSDDPALIQALGNAEQTRLLLKYGANIHVKDRKGRSALLYALQECCHETIDILKAAGAMEVLPNEV